MFIKKNTNVEKMGRRGTFGAVEILQARRETEPCERGLAPGESIRLSFLILAFAEHFFAFRIQGHLSSFFFFLGLYGMRM